MFCNLNIAIQQQRQCSSAQVDVADVPADLPVEPRSTPLAKQVWCSDLALSMVCRVLKQPLDMVVGNFGMARDCWGCRGCSFCGIFEGSPWRCHRPHRLPFQPLQRSGQWRRHPDRLHRSGRQHLHWRRRLRLWRHRFHRIDQSNGSNDPTRHLCLHLSRDVR